jgi:hypothetical protein
VSQRRDQILHDTVDLLRRSGASDIVVTRSKHHKVRFKFRDQTRMIVVATSPSRRDAGKSALATVKRVLRIRPAASIPSERPSSSRDHRNSR